MSNKFTRSLITHCTLLAVTVLTSLAQDAPSGEAVYKERCAYCHGQDGRGDGPPSRALKARPRDLTSGVYKVRSTESGTLPTEGDIIRTISMGLHGSSMPAFKDIISDKEILAVARYIQSFSPRFASERPRSVPVPRRVNYPESGQKIGKRLYEKLECGSCHGSDGTGADALATDFEDTWGNPIVAANLTEPWTFRGGGTERDIYLRLRTGMDGTPMPSYGGVVSDGELYNVAQYVASMARKPAWTMSAEELSAHYDGLAEKAKQDPVSWGKYLVSFLGCSDCHSPVHPDGSLMTDLVLAGGQKWEVKPYFNGLYPANLTSDEETGLAKYSDDQIRDALTKGIRLEDGSRMLPFPMPWPNYAGLRDEDITAIIAYLRTLPPVRNKVPGRDEPNIVAYLWYKFQGLILKKTFPAYIYSGNAGEQGMPSVSYAVPAGKEVSK